MIGSCLMSKVKASHKKNYVETAALSCRGGSVSDRPPCVPVALRRRLLDLVASLDLSWARGRTRWPWRRIRRQ